MLMSFVLLEVEELVVSTKLWPCAWVWLAYARNPRNLDFSNSARCAHPRPKGAVGGSTRSGYRSRVTQHHGPSAQETSTQGTRRQRLEKVRPACGQSAARAR